ncbi:MAG: SsrA-binding protein [Acidobacteria bacterium]|jgi:SsrA-binding protein|nr:SsrA-binding protein [Acidobacteriota bacterium]|tara:strand:+ start:7378 stop:7839 length:462 start_codon:yes stop_codon:yes gene_type:complete
MSDTEKVVTVNRKAHHNYEIVEKYEAGISLLGSEVKALREGRANLKDSYASMVGNQIVLLNCHIGPYQPAGPNAQHEPERPRPLLLNKREIDKLRGRIVERGFTLVPLRIYFRSGWAKIELGLGKGKRAYDKREAKKREAVKREIEQELRRRR